MAEITRKSRMAITKETTEGTLNFPSASTDYLALQDGFSVSLEIDTLENAELKASIGQSKSIQGFEAPTASVSHYIRHSGTEGQAPQDGYSNLLEAVFGSKTVNSTEYDTVGGSTTVDVEVDTGEGANFSVGQAVLVKHASNDHEIGIIESISGDTLTLLFALQNAPASGVNLGKAVHYDVVSEDHPTLSLFDYRANGGAIQAVAGTRVTSMSIDVTAGELINGSFEMEGIKGYFNPIEITASNNRLDFDEGGLELNATITQKAYKDPIELAAAIETAMDAQATADITVTYSNSTGKYTIASDGATFNLLWDTGTNSANTIGSTIGFDTAADDSGATSYVGDNAITLSSPQTPSFDSANPLVAKNNEVFLGDEDDNVCFSVQSLNYEVSTPKTDILDLCAESGKSGSIINEREVTCSLVANLTKYDAEKWNNFHKNQKVGFQFNFGTKSGGNWEPGKSGAIHIKDATINSHNLADADGIVTLELELSAFVDSSGSSETALNLL